MGWVKSPRVRTVRGIWRASADKQSNRSLPAKDRPKRRCEHSQNRGQIPSRFVTPSRKKYRHRMEAVKDQTPPNESLGGVEANKDNDQYALAIREGV